jgi:3-phosphoglycerate kinase
MARIYQRVNLVMATIALCTSFLAATLVTNHFLRKTSEEVSRLVKDASSLQEQTRVLKKDVERMVQLTEAACQRTARAAKYHCEKSGQTANCRPEVELAVAACMRSIDSQPATEK